MRRRRHCRRPENCRLSSHSWAEQRRADRQVDFRQATTVPVPLLELVDVDGALSVPIRARVAVSMEGGAVPVHDGAVSVHGVIA